MFLRCSTLGRNVFNWFLKQSWPWLIVGVIKRFYRNNCRQSAQALTFTSLFAIVPLLTILIVVLSSFEGLVSARKKMFELIYAYLLPNSTLPIHNYLQSFSNSAYHLTMVGLLFLFITALLMLMQIERVFNHIWGVKNIRWGLGGFTHYWALITVGPLVIGCLIAAYSAASSYHFMFATLGISSIYGYTANIDFWLFVISCGVTWVAFYLMFWGMPNRNVPFKAAAIGAVISTVLMVMLRKLFGEFVNYFSSYHVVYGAFAAFPLLLLWLYSIWMIVLFGVECSYALTIHTRLTSAHSTADNHPLFSILTLLHTLQQAQEDGVAISNNQAIAALGADGENIWTQCLPLLLDANIVQQTATLDVVLSRNLNHLTLLDICLLRGCAIPSTSDIIQMQDQLTSNAIPSWFEPTIARLNQYHLATNSQLEVPISQLIKPAKT